MELTSDLTRRSFLRTALAASVLGAAVDGLVARPAFAAATPLVSRATWGAFADGEPFPDLRSHYALEALVGRLGTMSWFQNWSLGLPQAAVEAGTKGYDLQIAWQPVLDGGKAVPFADILAGKWDAYVKAYFTSLKAYPHRATIRFAHEPNGSRYPWSPTSATRSCASPAQYVQVWRHLSAIKKSVGAANTSLEFCVANSDSGGVPFEAFWPGSAYVQVAAFDAYCGYSGGYISPHDTLAGTYARLTALTTRPIWVSELGCREPSRNDGVPADPTWTKAQWYGQVFALTEFPRIKHVNFFSALRERDWRVNSTAAATAVVKQNLAKAP